MADSYKIRRQVFVCEQYILSLEERFPSLFDDTTVVVSSAIYGQQTSETHLFLSQYPVLIFDTLALSVLVSFTCLFSPLLEASLTLALDLFTFKAHGYLLDTSVTHKQAQEHLSCFLRIGIVYNNTSTEPSLLCDRSDQLYLVVRCRIELQNCSRGIPQSRVQRGKESGETVRRGRCRMGGLGVEKPLKNRYTGT